MGVDVVIEDARWDVLGLPELADRAATATFDMLGLATAWEVALLATSDAEITRLNAGFRGKPSATNVLSWPAQTLTPPEPGDVPPLPEPDATGELFLGDIALAFETCRREAEDGGKPLEDHATHLIVHAVLHLLGYDHICDEDGALMERLETEILAQLDVADPYSGEPRQQN